MAYKFKPAARLLKTIGQDLVQDKYAAVVELVKNCYDADSPEAHITISFDYQKKSLTTKIKDSGEGMDLEIIRDKWLVPATPDKLHRKTSEKGRQLQGRKGIGRFAASCLGDLIFIDSAKRGSKRVSMLMDMDLFHEDSLLEDIPIDINEGDVAETSGTIVEIVQSNVSKSELDSFWGEKARAKLQIELSKLLAPSELTEVSSSIGYTNKKSPEFKIFLQFDGFDLLDGFSVEIKPQGVVDMFDYRIWGEVNDSGNLTFSYENQNTPNLQTEYVEKDLFLDNEVHMSFCGKVKFDIRAFDRDADSIDTLINRGLYDPVSNRKMGKRDARKLLDQYYGISLFRGDFRVRPYGDSEYDWLELDSKRIQRFSERLGHNQVIGFVHIEAEEKSGLEEKSARDGLVQNAHYEGLKWAILTVIEELAKRRFAYRNLSGRGRKVRTGLADQIEDFFNFEAVVPRIDSWLVKQKVEFELAQSISNTVAKELEHIRSEKRKDYLKVKETVALYQGQAALGKLTNLLLHEGKRHVATIANLPRYLKHYLGKLSKGKENQDLNEIESLIDSTSLSAKELSKLFKRIEPLSYTRSPGRKQIKIVTSIQKSVVIHKEQLEAAGIDVHIEIADDQLVYASEPELVTVFSNLIENSIYWLGVSKSQTKEINFFADTVDQSVEIFVVDTGPGFQSENLDLIFEPGISGRNGTGLGLAIVGETMQRLEGEVKALRNSEGAEFCLTFLRDKR